MTDRDIERFRRVEAVFNDALERPPGADREIFLREVFLGDGEMFEEVRQLLEDHDRVQAAAPPTPEVLPVFGPWQAIRLLGRGGMGTVYLAERADGAFQMSAAVKVVPLALASVDIEERFRRERQFLASLDHPKIARLIDGGVTGAGLPYLVMEFVDGMSIDRYCEAHSLGLRDRIGMVRQTLEALIYVHSRQVIHRDLKPSNILVDASGKVKLLDFGTARLVDSSGDNAITKTGVFAFTPEYASPEQVQGKAPTFASDIYSTGVLLSRLLTGHAPFPAAAGTTNVKRSPSGLPGPLDAILDTALRANPEERYASASELDADLARYLEGSPVRARRPRKWKPVAAIAALLAVAIAVTLYFARGSAPPAVSVAVLPFINAGSDPGRNYIGSGLTEGLTESLSRANLLRVVAPSAVAKFAGQPVNTGDAGRLLHVTNVIEGTVDAAGDRIKIAVRLERASDGAVLWSQSFERPEAELLGVQSEIAVGVERALKVSANPPAAAKHVPSAEAHEYVMRGRYEQQQMSSDGVARAEADFERAIDLDPEYAAAYLGLGLARYDRSAARGSNGQTEEERSSTQQLLRKALQIDPDLPAAHAWLALMAMQFNWDWEGAERELNLAATGAPNANVEQGFAFLRLFHGRFAEAEEHIRRMQDLDPFSTPTLNNLMLMRNLEGRYAESRDIAQKLLTAYPQMLSARFMFSGTYIEDGRTDLAMPGIKALEPEFPGAKMYEAMAFARDGRREDALRVLRPFEERYPNPGVAMQWFALVYGGLGDAPNTVKWLERSADRHEWQALNIGVHPVYNQVRNSPEFRALERRMGLAK